MTIRDEITYICGSSCYSCLSYLGAGLLPKVEPEASVEVVSSSHLAGGIRPGAHLSDVCEDAEHEGRGVGDHRAELQGRTGGVRAESKGLGKVAVAWSPGHSICPWPGWWGRCRLCHQE